MEFIESLIDIHGNRNVTFTNISDDKKLRLLHDCIARAQKEDPDVTEAGFQTYVDSPPFWFEKLKSLQKKCIRH